MRGGREPAPIMVNELEITLCDSAGSEFQPASRTAEEAPARLDEPCGAQPPMRVD